MTHFQSGLETAEGFDYNLSANRTAIYCRYIVDSSFFFVDSSFLLPIHLSKRAGPSYWEVFGHFQHKALPQGQKVIYAQVATFCDIAS